MDPAPRCPCGGPRYDLCCQPLHDGVVQASTAEELMRSRYSANVLKLANYLWRTWHPRTRPADVDLTDTPHWTGLQIVDVAAGSDVDDAGQVEFIASYTGGTLHERSRFARRASRWLYLDGDITTH